MKREYGDKSLQLLHFIFSKKKKKRKRRKNKINHKDGEGIAIDTLVNLLGCIIHRFKGFSVQIFLSFNDFFKKKKIDD